MKEKVFLITGVAIFLLFILILLNFIISNRLKKPQISNLITPTPTQPERNFSYPKKPTPKQLNQSPPSFISNLTPTQALSKKELEKITNQIQNNTLPSQQSLLITDFIKKLPLDNEFFSAQYLPLLNKIIFVSKNNQSLEKINQFLKENGLEEIAKKYPNLIVITDQKTAKDYFNQEDNFFKTKDLFIKSTPTQSNNNNDPILAFLEIYKIFNQMSKDLQSLKNINNESSKNQQLPPNNPANSINQISPNQLPEKINSSYNSLDDLINEVGLKVGVPKKILKGVIKIETGDKYFNLSSEKINLYSQPGNIIPNCEINSCSATGPMQITIGVDKYGSSSCSFCCNPNRCLTSCPNQWQIYGSAVNIFTGKTHQPNPCNLRDNLYAGAYKLKIDSQASNPLNWSYEEISRAATRYHGSCSDNYRYERLGNRTYCEFLWWYYTQN